MVNKTKIWKLKLEIKDLLFVAFQQINSGAFTNLACLVKGMLYILKTGQPCWVLVYSVLLLTLFSGNSWNAWWDWRHVRASSWCHISSLVIIFFPLFINSEELIYFQISEVPYLNSQTQFIITYYWSLCYKIYGYCNLWTHLRVRYVVLIRNSLVLSGFYPTDCQITVLSACWPFSDISNC